MRSTLLIASALLVLAGGAAMAQQPPQMGPPVTGAVKAVTDGHLLLATPSGEVDLKVDATTRVLKREATQAQDIKPGAYLGTSNLTAADGVSNAATEVHIMASGPNVHYAMDPTHNPALMMTNGHVKSVKTTAKGQEMEVDYGGATTRHVVVGQQTDVTQMAELGLAGLKPGMTVTARSTPGADGKPLARFILVGETK
jgi:hypothetical protein